MKKMTKVEKILYRNDGVFTNNTCISNIPSLNDIRILSGKGEVIIYNPNHLIDTPQGKIEFYIKKNNVLQYEEKIFFNGDYVEYKKFFRLKNLNIKKLKYEGFKLYFKLI